MTDWQKRAEDAERKLAAIVAAREKAGRFHDDRIHEMDKAFADAAPVAERHDRDVRAKELRRLADEALTLDGDCPFYGDEAHDAARWLRDEADRIEAEGLPHPRG